MAKRQPFWRPGQTFPLRGKHTMTVRTAVEFERSIKHAKREEESYHRVHDLLEMEAVEEAAGIC